MIGEGLALGNAYRSLTIEIRGCKGTNFSHTAKSNFVLRQGNRIKISHYPIWFLKDKSQQYLDTTAVIFHEQLANVKISK